MVSPPPVWVEWGIVKPGITWTLDRAVYGLRESPALWSQERDARLRELSWKVGTKSFRLHQCSADSQCWLLKQEKKDELCGVLITYVDDFLMNGPEANSQKGWDATNKCGASVPAEACKVWR